MSLLLPRERDGSYTPGAQYGLILLRTMDDADLLDVARAVDCVPGSAFHEMLMQMGSNTNHHWIIAGAAEEAYARGLIGEQELCWITR